MVVYSATPAACGSARLARIVAIAQTIRVDTELVQPLSLADDNLAFFTVDIGLLHPVAYLLSTIFLTLPVICLLIDKHLDRRDANKPICADTELLTLIDHALAATINFLGLGMCTDD